MFDVTFLTSNWTCIFGNGCQGVLTGPAPELVQGCCSYGAHLVNKKDARRVEKAAATLTPDEWQNHGTKKTVIHENKTGETVTRLVNDACIFLNKPDFPGGAGCAVHIAAMNRGVDHMTLKPEVCWQLPLRREDAVDDDEGHVTSDIRQWTSATGQGRRRFHWWCTSLPRLVGTSRHRRRGPELTKMVGTKAYDHFVELVEEPIGCGRRVWPSRTRQCGAAPARARPLSRSAAHRSARRSQSFSGSSSATALVGIDPRMRSYLSSSARHQDRGHRRAQPHIRHTGPSTPSTTTSDSALPRSADGVPFSRELLVTPGPHLGVPPTAGPHGPCRPPVHCSGCGRHTYPVPGQGRRKDAASATSSTGRGRRAA